MNKTLVVVASNNGEEHLKRLFKSLQEVYWGVEAQFLVVDTGSTKQESLDYLPKLEKEWNKRWPDNHLLVERIKGGFDTGAYLAAYHLYPDYDHYLFMHDSMEAKEQGWIREFVVKTSPGIVCPWLTFDFFWDNDEQPAYIREALGIAPHVALNPERGIFGPIFCITKADMEKLKAADKLPTPPVDKISAQAWERGWSVALASEGIMLNPIEHGFDFARMDRLEYPILNKYRPGR